MEDFRPHIRGRMEDERMGPLDTFRPLLVLVEIVQSQELVAFLRSAAGSLLALGLNIEGLHMGVLELCRGLGFAGGPERQSERAHSRGGPGPRSGLQALVQHRNRDLFLFHHMVYARNARVQRSSPPILFFSRSL